MIKNGYFGPFTQPSKRARKIWNALKPRKLFKLTISLVDYANLDNLMRTLYSNEDNEAFDVYEENDEAMSVYDLVMNQKRQEKPSITSLCCKQECSLPTLITFCP